MDAFREIEETQAALDEVYAKLLALRQNHGVEELENVHGRAEEALAGARALVDMLEGIATGKKDTYPRSADTSSRDGAPTGASRHGPDS